MNLTLQRTDYTPNGIFGILTNDSGDAIFVTLEHSYDNVPKIPEGTYLCVKGMHRLASMTSDFTTFEITNVTGHTNILFHKGNFNNDSEGCVLIGRSVNPSKTMICESSDAFDKFMEIQSKVNEFTLIVVS